MHFHRSVPVKPAAAHASCGTTGLTKAIISCCIVCSASLYGPQLQPLSVG